jgi:hypothetical protein
VEDDALRSRAKLTRRYICLLIIFKVDVGLDGGGLVVETVAVPAGEDLGVAAGGARGGLAHGVLQVAQAGPGVQVKRGEFLTKACHIECADRRAATSAASAGLEESVPVLILSG